MPRGRSRFFHRKHRTVAQVKQKCCVICYRSYYPFINPQSKWEAGLTKVFYKALSIPPFTTGSPEDGDEEVPLLPYCPDCHSRMSVMFNLYTQLEVLQNQYACVRNEIAFIVVETIGRNSKNGPMDYIRKQIYEKWSEYYVEEREREDFAECLGLEALAGTSQLDMQDIYDSIQETKLRENDGSEFDDTLQTDGDDEEHDDETVDDDLMIIEDDSENHQDFSEPNETSTPYKKSARGTTSKKSDNEPLANGDDQITQDESLQDTETNEAGKTANGVKMPRLFAMSDSGDEASPSSSVRSNKAGKTRTRGRGYAGSSYREIPPNKFYVNHFETQEDDGSFTVNDLSVDVKPSLKSLRRRSTLASSMNTNPAGEQDSGETSQRSSRYPTRHSGRSRHSFPPETAEQPSDANIDEPGTSSDLLTTVPEVVDAPPVPSGATGIFRCRLCPKFYYLSSRLLRHESLCHPSLKSHRCDYCNKGFSSRITYKRHMGNAHPGVPTEPEEPEILQCPVCARTFSKKSSYTIHLKSHKLKVKGKPRGLAVAIANGKVARKGKLAQKRSIRNGTVSSSRRKIKQRVALSPENARSEATGDSGGGNDLGEYPCRICHKVFPYRTLLNMHFLTHTRKNFKCKTCLSSFATYTELKFHVDEVHRNKLPSLPCSVCGQKFNGAESLQRHFKIHDLKQELVEPPENEEEQDDMFLQNNSDEILPN